MFHAHIDGLQPSFTPELTSVQVFDAYSGDLLFQGDAEEASLYVEISGLSDTDVEFQTIHELGRGFE